MEEYQKLKEELNVMLMQQVANIKFLESLEPTDKRWAQIKKAKELVTCIANFQIATDTVIESYRQQIKTRDIMLERAYRDEVEFDQLKKNAVMISEMYVTSLDGELKLLKEKYDNTARPAK